MIWDILSPLYDFFETIYNANASRALRKKLKITSVKMTWCLNAPAAQAC